MANKREFKKALDFMGGELCENMMLTYVNEEKSDKKKISEAIGKILAATDSARKNANIFFDRGPKGYADRKAYSKEKRNFFKTLFDKIVTDYNEAISESLKIFNSALPESVKEEQKQSVKE